MMKRSLFLILTTLLSAHYIWGDDNSNSVIKTAVPFLTIAPDSRSGAMGDAGVATSPDLYSQNWNVSKYAFLEDHAGVSLSYTPWLRNLGINDLNLLYLSGYYKFDDIQSLSGSVRYFNLGQIEELDESGVATGSKIRPNEYAIDLGYSRMFSEYISAGLAFRFIRSDIANGSSSLSSGVSGATYDPANAWAADIGVYYQKPIQVKGYDAEMAIGGSISNIGTKIDYSDGSGSGSQFIPANLRLGGRYTMDIDQYNSFSVNLDFNKLLVPITDTTTKNMGPIEGIFNSFSDAPDGFSEELKEIMWSFGLEYMYLNQFAIRAGYFNENEDKGDRKYFTAGVGLYLNVFSLDFSYLIPAQGGRNSPLANTMRFSLGFRFE